MLSNRVGGLGDAWDCTNHEAGFWLRIFNVLSGFNTESVAF
jgi:hypothetical protein